MPKIGRKDIFFPQCPCSNNGTATSQYYHNSNNNENQQRNNKGCIRLFTSAIFSTFEVANYFPQSNACRKNKRSVIKKNCCRHTLLNNEICNQFYSFLNVNKQNNKHFIGRRHCLSNSQMLYYSKDSRLHSQKVHRRCHKTSHSTQHWTEIYFFTICVNVLTT